MCDCAKELTEGSNLLATFIEAHAADGLNQGRAAEALRVSAATICHWLKGRMRPRAAHRRAIELWTGGQVPASSWETPEERAEGTVAPYSAAA